MRQLVPLLEQDAATDAKRKGLEYASFGRWKNKKGQVVAKTVDGKLVMVQPSEDEPAQKQNGNGQDTATSASAVPSDVSTAADSTAKEAPPSEPSTAAKDGGSNGKPQTPAMPATQPKNGNAPSVARTQAQAKTALKPSDFPDSDVYDTRIKLKNLIPRAQIDTDTVLPNVPEAFRAEVSARLDQLKKMADDARARGEKAPNYNLCSIHIPGTNLFCGGNKGVPRVEMPQFKGPARPGSPADKLPKNKDGEVDADALFSEILLKNGIKVVQGKVPADRLKATQMELIGPKVAGMVGALEKDPHHPVITMPIFVSRDGYVLDGHHRWASMVGYSLKKNQPLYMDVKVIDMDIDTLLPLANRYAKEIGIESQSA